MDEKVFLTDDCISREAAFAVIEEKQKELCPAGLCGRKFASDKDKYDAWQEILEELEAIPTADVKLERYGRWIDEEDGRCRCSMCGNHMSVNWNYDIGMGWFYCPNCGAIMGGGKNENGV